MRGDEDGPGPNVAVDVPNIGSKAVDARRPGAMHRDAAQSGEVIRHLDVDRKRIATGDGRGGSPDRVYRRRRRIDLGPARDRRSQ